ncbi:hypothetical protein [Lentzea sp. NBRC 102530]|uniref:hypothetical protein n=1 Tax=Lentzea sp. NBRC 102530 TaxID=3032201 RepID=UPI0025566325|nr:hypothetical protein [Lentzea sp. NBRC 102530]
MTDEKWVAKHWLNVPGPFYTGLTDNCWTGRLVAPRHVLYGGEHRNEFVYRQPKTPDEVENVWRAADDDPLDGYADDGDERWTPEAVRAWWHDRDKVVEHVTELIAEWSTQSHPERVDAAQGGRDFLAYLAGDLEADLRAYVFRLDHGRDPAPGDVLPAL